MMGDQKKSQHTIIFLTVFIYLAGFGIIIPIMPVLGREFGASSFQVGLLMSVYSLMQFIFSPFWGRLSDRWGRRPILLFCLFGEVISYGIFALARDLEVLFVARILAGFFGASISTASAYISDITPPQERSKGMALIGAAFGLGFIVGPALGGGLVMLAGLFSTQPHFSTSFAAAAVSLLCLGNFFFAWKFLTESLNREVARSNPQKSMGRFQQIFSYAKKPIVGPLIGVYFLSAMSMSIMEATLVLFVGDRFGWGIREVSFGFAYIGLTSAFCQGYLVRKALPLWGERKLLFLGLIALALGISGIAVSQNIWILAAMMTILAFGNSFTNPSTLGSISLLSPAAEQGAVMGTTQGLSSLGRILGPALGGFIYSHLAIVSPFIAGGIFAFCGLIVVVVLYSRLPELGKVSV